MDTRKRNIVIVSSVIILILIIVGIFFLLKKAKKDREALLTPGFETETSTTIVPRNVSGTGSADGTLAPTKTGTVTISETSTTNPREAGTSSTSIAPAVPRESPTTGMGVAIPSSSGNSSNSGAGTPATETPGGNTTNPSQRSTDFVVASTIVPTEDPVPNISVVEPVIVDPSAGTLVLKPLPNDDPNTTINERDEEMKKRVFDEVWRTWELDERNIIGEKTKQRLYGQFSSVKQNITDAKSLRNSKNLLETVKEQNIELADAYHDCSIIRQASQQASDEGKTSTDTAFWDGVKSKLILSRIRNSFSPEASIIGTAEKHHTPTDFMQKRTFVMNDPFWKNFYEPMDQQDLPGFKDDDLEFIYPQILPATSIQDVINYDNGKTLFCRLPRYFQYYWAPDKLKGRAISCYSETFDDTNSTGEKSKATAKWYETNVAEIFYNSTTPGGL